MWPMSAATPIALLEVVQKWEQIHVKLTGSKTDIVEGELANPGVELEEERERLTNAYSFC